MIPSQNDLKIKAKLLWQYYYSHGEKLLIEDVTKITAKYHLDLYKSFKRFKIKAPPVFNSNTEKVRRKAKILRDEANRLKQIVLTERQAAKVLGIKFNRLPDVLTQIEKKGFDYPEIVKEIKRIGEDNVPYGHPFALIHGMINYRYYPSGLQYMQSWDGPKDNQTTYLLR